MTPRSLAVTALLALTAVPAAGHAAPARRPAPQIVDRQGDWVVPSSDIVRGVISKGAARDSVEMRIGLVAAPAAPASYQFGFGVVGVCDHTFVRIDLTTSSTPGTPVVQRSSCNSSTEVVPQDRTVTDAVASARIEGTELVFTLSQASRYGVKPGARVTGLSAIALVAPVYVFVFGDGGDTAVGNGDIAWGRTDWVVPR